MIIETAGQPLKTIKQIQTNHMHFWINQHNFDTK